MVVGTRAERYALVSQRANRLPDVAITNYFAGNGVG
jgi:hypothetical protein